MAEAPEAPVLELDDVHLSFGRTQVLRGLKVGIRKGETVAVIGESGCGKTVLLKLLVGLIEPTRGEVRFDGKVLTKLPSKDLVAQRLRFGFVFQQAALFDSLNVFENVAFALRAHRSLGEEPIRDLVK
ncbi:MAG TPA: ATP-binding cassette domain-containing protein, partial [Planctomycetia bacterium]|nr:ATP-binding cassette domain-containing protein [Planctomycetia bacterium]